MRLTLRTLLAYLDDTLDPTEIKQIGQKAAESDAAQELIARIKQVTRRRRITAPPSTGPGAKVDANTIAEYLDNVLSSDQVAELEKTCLDSDVHLAEVAACHQILTLVLGEPALVPPTARQRMYSLVRGKEAIPSRKAAAVRPVGRGLEAEPAADSDDDDTMLGLPLGKGGRWARWLIPVSALGLLALLVLVLFQALGPGSGPQHAQNKPPALPPTMPETPRPTTPVVDVSKPDPNKPDPGAVDPNKPDPNKPDPTKPDPNKPDPNKPDPNKPDPNKPEPPPADVQPKEVGRVALVEVEPGKVAPYSLLVRPVVKGNAKEWEQVKPDAAVSTGDTLVSLPGFRSVIRTSAGVDLTLWGNVPEFIRGPFLESAVRLGAPADKGAKPADVDLEFYLERGRVLLTNRKDGPVKVRVHFHQTPLKRAETWELTLKTRGTEMALDLQGLYLPGMEFNPDSKTAMGPAAALRAVLLRGQAGAKIGPLVYENLEAQDPTRAPTPDSIFWDSLNGMPQQEAMKPQFLVAWDKAFPDKNPMLLQLEGLSKRVANTSVERALETMLLGQMPPDPELTPALAIYCLGALDELPKVLDVLEGEDDTELALRLRGRAILTLRHWLGRRVEHDLELYQLLQQGKRYSTNQALAFMQLLHDPTAQDLVEKKIWETWIVYLKHEKPAIRELAFWQLWRLVPPEIHKDLLKYSPAGNSDKRQMAFDAWQKLAKDGKIPAIPR